MAGGGARQQTTGAGPWGETPNIDASVKQVGPVTHAAHAHAGARAGGFGKSDPGAVVLDGKDRLTLVTAQGG